MAMAVDPGAAARGIVAMVVDPGAAAHHGIVAGAVDLTGVVECRGIAVMVEIATTAAPHTTVVVLLTTVATTVAAHLITVDTRTTVEMHSLLLLHRHLKILNTRL